MESMWAYSAGGVLSESGRFQVSSADRYNFMVRLDGAVTLIACERFTNDDGVATVAFDTGSLRTLRDIRGERAIRPEEVREIIDLLTVAMPLLELKAVFE